MEVYQWRSPCFPCKTSAKRCFMENTSDCNNFHCRKGIELTVPFISTDVIAYRGCRKKNPDLGRSYVLDWCHFTTLSWRFLCRIGLPYLRSVPKLLHSAEFYRNIRNWRRSHCIAKFHLFYFLIYFFLTQLSDILYLIMPYSKEQFSLKSFL